MKQAVLDALMPAINYLKELTLNDKVLVIGHGDADGLTSTAILSEFLDERLIKHDCEFSSTNAEMVLNERVFELLEKSNANKLIVLDLNFNEQLFMKLNELAIKVLVMDHHLIDFTPKNIVYLNARGLTEEVASVSSLTFKVCERAGLNKKIVWLALVGASSDRMLSASLELLELTDFELQAFVSGKELDASFDYVVYALTASYFDDAFNKPLFNLLKESVKQNNPLFLFNEKKGKAKKIFDLLDCAELEALDLIKKSTRIIDSENKTLILLIEPKLRVKRFIVEILRLQFPDFIVMCASPINGKLEVSCRSNLIDLLKALPFALKDISGSGFGGHPFSGGVTLPKESMPIFLSQLNDFCYDFYNNKEQKKLF